MLREQNKRLARQALREVLRSRLFWLMVGGGVLLDLAREGGWILHLAGGGLLFLLVLAILFAHPDLFFLPDPEWGTYYEVRRLREEVRRLRRGQ
ncbi:MAG: hypothetical protein ACP5JV_11000 [Thermus sp.]|jgi:hypothetical protein|uniref:hypothetical protein n=1 Tax=Thermus sp. TaxID=275 RepID=UPI003D0C1922